jgi:hypothetical protein
MKIPKREAYHVMAKGGNHNTCRVWEGGGFSSMRRELFGINRYYLG